MHRHARPAPITRPSRRRDSPALGHDAARWSRLWLALGLALLLISPEARGHSALLGWLPFWLVLAPALVLLANAPRGCLNGFAAGVRRIVPARGRRQAVRIAPRR